MICSRTCILGPTRHRPGLSFGNAVFYARDKQNITHFTHGCCSNFALCLPFLGFTIPTCLQSMDAEISLASHSEGGSKESINQNATRIWCLSKWFESFFFWGETDERTKKLALQEAFCHQSEKWAFAGFYLNRSKIKMGNWFRFRRNMSTLCWERLCWSIVVVVTVWFWERCTLYNPTFSVVELGWR